MMIEDLIQWAKTADDQQFVDSAQIKLLEELFTALTTIKGEVSQTLYDKLLHNKNRLVALSLLRQSIHERCAFEGIVNGTKAFVSPTLQQWFDNGIMLMQGKAPFEGCICCYQDGELKFAITAREVISGEMLGPQDFRFVGIQQLDESTHSKRKNFSLDNLRGGIEALELLIQNRVDDESAYQQILESHSWMLGAQYSRIEPHKKFDDRNIPDFTGVRTRDGFRDIIEIKHPFVTCFRQDGDFSSEFNQAWNQGERYLAFARKESDYLRRQKSLDFENPNCWLLMGLELTPHQRQRLIEKGSMNPAIQFATYRDVLTMAKGTFDLISVVVQNSRERPQ